MAQGNGPGAMEEYRKELAIAEHLASRDGANSQWQRDLAVSHEKIGDVLVAQSDVPGAMEEYRMALLVLYELAARDSANTKWQHDLAVSNEKIGEMLVAQDDVLGALAEYRKALAIHEALAARDSANTAWQRYLALSHERIGGVLEAMGEGPGALAEYRKALRSPRSARGTRYGEHAMAARSFSKSRKDRRRACGAGQPAWRVGRLPQETGDRRSAGAARWGQHRHGSATLQ